MNQQLLDILDDAASADGRIVVLTGAGISAESGIPTFRGEEGYWVVGSRHYQPQELATNRTFSSDPDLVWPWYLYRRATCRRAAPNAGHLALVALERHLGERFVLVTQNVDGLHLRAGNSIERTWQIHGNIDYMRCSEACTSELRPVPEGFEAWGRGDALTDAHRARLRCHRCGALARPHVLWFDEMYDEERYRFESSLRVVSEAALLLVIGTAGATNLPIQMAGQATRRGVPIVDINPSDNPFAQLARRAGGWAATGSSGDELPPMVERLCRTA